MTYIPAQFRETDPTRLRALMEAHPLAVLITSGAGGTHVSHVPLHFDPSPAPHGRLIGHLARANPQATDMDAATEAIAVFTGVDTYVSPSAYASKREHGKVVPTWNYAAVYAHGQLRFLDEAETAHGVVSQLTDTHEARRADPWAVTDAPDDYVAANLRAIRAFEIVLTRVEGKWKMSQNRNEADRNGVIAALAQGDDRDRAVHDEMRGLFPDAR